MLSSQFEHLRIYNTGLLPQDSLPPSHVPSCTLLLLNIPAPCSCSLLLLSCSYSLLAVPLLLERVWNPLDFPWDSSEGGGGRAKRTRGKAKRSEENAIQRGQSELEEKRGEAGKVGNNVVVKHSINEQADVFREFRSLSLFEGLLELLTVAFLLGFEVTV